RRFEDLLDIADRVLNRVTAAYEEKLFPAIPRVWKTEVEDLRTDFCGWLRHWHAIQREWQPIHYEFAFGLSSDDDAERDPESRKEAAVIVGGARVRGSIDLVEQHRTRGVLRITDHKTGKAPADMPALIGGGALLQPVLYGLAVEQLLGKPAE